MPGIVEHAVAREGVQVHARLLPGRVPRDRRPLAPCRGPAPSASGTARPAARPARSRLVALEVAHERRQRRRVVRLADQVGVAAPRAAVAGLRVDHLDHVGQRRRRCPPTRGTALRRSAAPASAARAASAACRATCGRPRRSAGSGRSCAASCRRRSRGRRSRRSSASVARRPARAQSSAGMSFM